MPTPTVTVIIPTHARERSLGPALQSVFGQTFNDFELILIDDGSGADFAGLLPEADARVSVIRNSRNLGPAAARNRGIAKARGAHIAFLDSDDIWPSHKLQSQLAWMQAQPLSPRVCCTGYRVVTHFRPDGEERTPNAVTKVGELLWGCGLSPGSTMVVEKSIFDEVGLFDESLRRLEDWDWLLRCVQKTPIAVMPFVLATIHASEREVYPLEDVRNSASRMKAYMAQGRYPLARAQRKTMLSTLHSEVAAAAFRRRHYGLAATSMLRSMYHNPFRRMDYYRRIFSALCADVKMAAGAGGSPQRPN
ncbi:MAG: glycosyltransferase family 2 protein [Methyloceanibacter sp.]